jgi:uncharacterized integral membrane protein
MRIIYMALFVVLVCLVAVFALQNLQTVTVSFFEWSLTLPVALLVAGVYLLGMATGGTVLAFFRRTLHKAKKTD